MTQLVAQERQTYDDIWATLGAEYDEKYSPGEVSVPLFLSMVGEERGTLLDAGCGSGRGAVKLQEAGFDVLLCDITDAGLMPAARALPFGRTALWDELWVIPYAARGIRTVEWVYCCDVLEHIPPALTMLTIVRLCEVATRGVFLTVSLRPDRMGVWVGRPLHQTVQSFTWWRDHLATVARVREARDLLQSAVFLLDGHADAVLDR